MFLKWLSNNGDIDLIDFDAVAKWTLIKNSIVAYDAFVSTKVLSIGVFQSRDEAMKVFNEIVRRINLLGNTDDVSETDLVFDVASWLENNNDPWN